MPEVEEQLRRYATGAERAVAPVPVPVPVPAPGARARPDRHRWLAIAAVAAVVAGLLVVVLNDDDAQVSTDPSTPTSPSSTTTNTVDDTTVTTAVATRSLRIFPVVAVTDREYLVWSGEAGDNELSARADGFAVDLTTGEVRTIPVAPIDPRSGATGVWTGDELLVCCGATGVNTRSAAAWDPDSGEWRTLAVPPAEVAGAYLTSVWTGDLMVVVAPGGTATYDPDADVWEDIPTPLMQGRQPEAAWTGDTVIAWDSAYGADLGYSWAPGDDAWTPLPTLPPGSRTRMGSMAWTGTELVVWGQSTDDDALGVGARWRPGDDSWRPMASWPHNPVEDPYNGTQGSQSLAATGDGRVLVTGLDGGSAEHTDLYDPRSDTWLDLGFTVSGYHPTVTVAADQVLIPDEARPFAGRLP